MKVGTLPHRAWRSARACFAHVRRRLYGVLLGAPPWHRTGLERLGSAYGGWWVPSWILHTGTIAYCAGAGEDITFDVELLKRGCTVRTFDPTPRAVSHVRALRIEDHRFAFAPVGVWCEDASVRMYAPRDGAHVSHSIVNLQQTTDYIEVPVESLTTLTKRFGDDHIDLLKLDVEGAEYAVLRSLVELDPVPRAICVEFDQPSRLSIAREALRGLKTLGYRPVTCEGFNVLLVQSD
jgi:FkbM family methyltransferase